MTQLNFLLPLTLLFTLALGSPSARLGLQKRTSPPVTCIECEDTPNNCDITAPCASAFGQKLLCGCRPGYRATGVDPTDISKQWRVNVPYHEHRVWVAPGVKCDTLCNWPFGAAACGEVPFVDHCIVFPPPQM